MKLPTDRVLIFDIETNSTEVEQAKLRYFGAYSYINGKRYYIKGVNDLEFIQEIIDNHDVIVGFNQKKFDCPILENHGISFKYKTQIDLWEVLSDPKLNPKTRERTGGKGRGAFMGLKLNSWTLSNIVSVLKLGEYKQDNFDYSLLKKEPHEWTQKEHDIILKYLAQDITITKRLFEYTNNFYYAFTEHLSEKNTLRFTYLTASIASLAYKIICHEAKLPETYGEGEKHDYGGGYVRYPIKENHVGDILCLDFNSLYPSIFRGFNLFSPAKPDTPEDEVFSGNDFFKVKGRYIKSKLGIIEKVVEDLYNLRKKYISEGDRREYLIKIIINSLYGITPKPVFDQIYNRYGAEDCTAIGRQMVQHVADVFNERGFEVLYGDTDSVYVALNNKTKEEALEVAKELDVFFKSKMPLPHDDFGLGLDAEIKAMFFVKSDNKYKKKNYMYIKKVFDKKTKEYIKDELVIMGLPIIKSNASKIATLILNKHLKEQIIEKSDCKFHKDYLKQLIYYELENDINLAVQTYKVKPFEEYDIDTSLYAQISKQYGAEKPHDLITNYKYGIGKQKKYCTIEEFHKNNCTVRDIDLTITLNNLEPFIKNTQTTLEAF